MTRLQDHYREKVVPELTAEVRLQEPDGSAANREDHGQHRRRQGHPGQKLLDNAVGDLTKITGQKPVITKAKKSIANFKFARRLSRSAAWSRCAASECTSSSTAW